MIIKKKYDYQKQFTSRAQFLKRIFQTNIPLKQLNVPLDSPRTIDMIMMMPVSVIHLSSRKKDKIYIIYLSVLFV